MFVLMSLPCGHQCEGRGAQLGSYIYQDFIFRLVAQCQPPCTQSFGMRSHVLDSFLIMLGLGLFASVISVSFKVIENNITPLYFVQKLDSVLLCRRFQRTNDFDGCDEGCEDDCEDN